MQWMTDASLDCDSRKGIFQAMETKLFLPITMLSSGTPTAVNDSIFVV